MRKYLNLSFVLVALMLVPTAFYSSDAQAYGAIFGKFISKAFKNGSRQVIKNAEKVAKPEHDESDGNRCLDTIDDKEGYACFRNQFVHG